MTRAHFITFEGGEGSGKSTQSKMLYEYLLSRDINVIWTREIGGTPEGEQIRDLIMREELLDMSSLLLIMAARFEHVNNLIKPALTNGTWVICDRFIDSSLAYQGEAIGEEKILKLYCDLFGDFMPDKTFFIDLEPSIGLKRAILRGESNKFDLKNIEFHNKVYNKFKSLATSFPERITTIDGTKNVEEIHHEIISRINLDR